MKLSLKKVFFIISLLFVLFFVFDNKVNATADFEGFNAFVEENFEELNRIFFNYDYLVVNHYSNYFIVYYTNCPNNKFSIDYDIWGKGNTVVSSTSDLGNNLFSRFFFNPNNDSNFRLPTNLLTTFSEYDFEHDRNYVINNYSLDKVLYSSKPFTSFGNVINTKKSFESCFKPVLENLNFVRTTEGIFIATDVLDFDLYYDYSLEFYSLDNNNWSKSGTKKEYENRYYINDEGNNVTTIGIRFYCSVSDICTYTLRLHKDNSDIVSNSASYTVTDLDVAIDVGKLYYDLPAPNFSYDFKSGKAIVYTQYLDINKYDNINLMYYNDKHTYSELDWVLVPLSICSKEYNKDKTQFRFKLEFTEPVTYSFRFMLDMKDSSYGLSLYYSNISTLTITSEFFETEGYKKEKGFFSRLWDWLINFVVHIFIPEDSYIDSRISNISDKLNEKIPYKQYLEDFEEIEQITDTTSISDEINVNVPLTNYKISDNLTINSSKFIDFSIFSDFRNNWYSWIRVVFYILLIIFNINMCIKFLRGVGVVEGSVKLFSSSDTSSSKK